MPQDRHWSIQGFKHHSWALGSSQQWKLKISNVLLWKLVFRNQDNKETAVAKSWKHFLQWARRAAVAFAHFYGMTGEVLVAWPAWGIPTTHHQTHANILAVHLGRYGPIPGLLVEKNPGRRLQECLVPQLHPCTGPNSREKRAEESKPPAGWTLRAQRALAPLFAM